MGKNDGKKDDTLAILLGLGIGAILLSKLVSAEELPPIPPIPPVPPSEDVKITDIKITKV